MYSYESATGTHTSPSLLDLPAPPFPPHPSRWPQSTSFGFWKQTNTTENREIIQKIIRDYYEQLHANKMENLKEMDKLLEKYNLPKWNQKEIENMNRPITNMEIKTVIKKNLPINKRPGPDGFTGEFYQKFREELAPILLKLFQKTAEEGKVPNSLYDIKTRQRYHKKTKLQASITNEHRCKSPQQGTSKPNLTIH